MLGTKKFLLSVYLNHVPVANWCVSEMRMEKASFTDKVSVLEMSVKHICKNMLDCDRPFASQIAPGFRELEKSKYLGWLYDHKSRWCTNPFFQMKKDVQEITNWHL